MSIPGIATLYTGPLPPGHVRVLLRNGERLDVPRDELELLPHPCRGESDATLADWVLDALEPWHWGDDGSLAVAQFVPRQFDAVARILHPWDRDHPNDGTARWSEVVSAAAVSDERALAELRGDSFSAVPGFSGPDEGELGGTTTRALIAHLRTETQTPDDVLFAVWEGWGGDPWERFADAAWLPFANRTSRLLRGTIEGALSPLGMSFRDTTLKAMVWWPADRAWVVHSEIDWPWSLVAGSEDLIAALIGDPGLEVVRTTFDSAGNRVD
jgi:hypothetical protein